MEKTKRLLCLIAGPALFVLIALLGTELLGVQGAKAVGVAVWMIFWWVTRPIDIIVTAILPVILNALLQIVEQPTVISQYASESIILIVGSTMLTAPWASIGLDRRIALKALALIGPSMKSQMIVWTIASVVLSTVLPNIVVISLFVPIAVAMCKAAGFIDIENSEPAQMILLAISFAVSLGGCGTPMGGAMNVTSIAALQDYYGIEFLYSDWVKRIIPFLIVMTILQCAMMMIIPMKTKKLDGTKEFFKQQYAELGPMKVTEKFSLALFIVALVGSLTRTWWGSYLPGLVPAYLFVLLGFICYFISFKGKGVMLTWKETQDAVPWGMMVLFASGMALGKMLTGSGATQALADIIIGMNLDGGFTTLVVLVIFSRIISEVTNGTTAAALTCPIIFAFAATMNINPIPYWFVNVMAYNAEYLLPLSVRAVPVAYGLKPNNLMKYGWWQTIINCVFVILIGWAMINLWPNFGVLANFTWQPA